MTRIGLEFLPVKILHKKLGVDELNNTHQISWKTLLNSLELVIKFH